MNSLIYWIRMSCSLFILMLLYSCGDTDIQELQPNNDTVKIILDLEDYLYKYEDSWYRLNDETQGCDPSFSVYYELTENELELVFCTSVGELSDNTLQIGNQECGFSDIAGAISLIDSETQRVNIPIQEDLRLCMVDKNDWLEIEFDFSFD